MVFAVSIDYLLWMIFSISIVGTLIVDLGIFHRRAHIIRTKEALSWSLVWIGLALAFNFLIYAWKGPDKALAFFTGYLIEKSLSFDNLFVFLLIFSYFAVNPLYQHRVLFWGIVGALIMRGVMIALGFALVHTFEWVLYAFGAFLIFAGIKMAIQKEKVQPEKNLIVKQFKKFAPIMEKYEGGKFFIKSGGKLFATPLFIVLLMVETTDLAFAVDSIPAIFSITTDPFIVYTSNIFAVSGLRALYFLLAGIMGLFSYLRVGLAAVLTFIGMKMLVADFYEISVLTSLTVIAVLLAASILASMMAAKFLPSFKMKQAQLLRDLHLRLPLHKQ